MVDLEEFQGEDSGDSEISCWERYAWRCQNDL